MTTAKRMYQMLSENVSKSESKMLKNETINSNWKKPKSAVIEILLLLNLDSTVFHEVGIW